MSKRERQLFRTFYVVMLLALLPLGGYVLTVSTTTWWIKMLTSAVLIALWLAFVVIVIALGFFYEPKEDDR